MANKNSKKKKPETLTEDTTFIVMVLRPATEKDDFTGSFLTGWCVIAARGLSVAMRHVREIDLGVDLRGAKWTDVSGGKTAALKDGYTIQVLPAPLYFVDTPEPLIKPATPYVM